MTRAERLERSYAYHLAKGSWQPSAVVELKEELPNAANGAPAARHAIREAAGQLLGEEEIEVVEILTTELVTNAVAHAGTGPEDAVVLHLAVAPERIRVEVCDGGPGFAPEDFGRPRAGPGGFGLVMVDRAASRWGVAGDDGNCVWFELDREPA